MLLPCWLYSDVFLSRTVKGLGEADDEEESAAQWIIRMREFEKEKELAKKRVCVPSTVLFW